MSVNLFPSFHEDEPIQAEEEDHVSINKMRMPYLLYR